MPVSEMNKVLKSMLEFNWKALAGVALACSGILTGNVLGDEKPATARDRLGDPLPSGAVARLGTVRLRGSGHIYTMAFSHDGKRLATLDDKAVRVWSVATGKELAYVAQHYNNAMCGLTFSADGNTLVSVGDGPALLLHDLSALSEKEATPTALTKPRLVIPQQGNAAALLAFLPDGKTLLSGDSDGHVHLWDAGNGREMRAFGTIARAMHCYALSPDGKTLAVAPYGKAPALWDVAMGEMIGQMPGREVVDALAFSPDGKRLAAAIDASNAIRLFDVATRKEVRSLGGRKKPPVSSYFGSIGKGLAFLPDGKTLVSLDGQLDDKIRLWDVASGEQRRSIQGWHDDGVLALSSDGRIVAAAGSNGVVRLWELPSGKELHADRRQGRVFAVAVSPDSRQVAVGSYEGIIRLYERATAVERYRFPAEAGSIHDLAFSPDGKSLVAAVPLHAAKLWDVASGKLVRSFPGSPGAAHSVNYVAFSPDGAQVALSTHEPGFSIVESATGKQLRRLGEKKDKLSRLAFTPDGTKLAGGGFDNAIHLWDVASGKELWKTGTAAAVAAVACSPDRNLVATGDYAGTVAFWSVARGENVVCTGHPGHAVHAVAFAPAGGLFAAAGEEGTILLLEMATGTPVRRLRGHKGTVWALAFSCDGRSLVSGSDDSTALVWDMTGRACAPKPAAALNDADLESLWTDLGAARGAKGYGAVWALLQSGKQGLEFLQARLSQAPDGQTVARLIAQLDDDAFVVREKASAALARMGHVVRTPLKETLAKNPSPEVRRRLEAILGKLEDKGDARLRGLRSVAVLTYADAPEARTLLQRLADKDPSEEIRLAARRALKRRENAVSKP